MTMYYEHTEDTLKELDGIDLIDAFEESVMAYCWHTLHENSENEKRAITAMLLIRDELSTRLTQRY